MKVNANEIKAGDYILCDSGFDCVENINEPKLVEKDVLNMLYFKCDHGKHYLEGQLDYNSENLCYVGIQKYIKD